MQVLVDLEFLLPDAVLVWSFLHAFIGFLLLLRIPNSIVTLSIASYLANKTFHGHGLGILEFNLQILDLSVYNKKYTKCLYNKQNSHKYWFFKIF